jgi:hypothetical protein
VRAVDTNILVYAQVAATPQHEPARRLLFELAETALPWAIPWPCVYEFLRVVTHPRLLHPPMSFQAALAEVKSLLESPQLLLLAETSRHAEVMEQVVRRSCATGNLMYDAHIAALCLEHGVSEIITSDRDFLRFPGLKVFNPFGEA